MNRKEFQDQLDRLADELGCEPHYASARRFWEAMASASDERIHECLSFIGRTYKIKTFPPSGIFMESIDVTQSGGAHQEWRERQLDGFDYSEEPATAEEIQQIVAETYTPPVGADDDEEEVEYRTLTDRDTLVFEKVDMGRRVVTVPVVKINR